MKVVTPKNDLEEVNPDSLKVFLAGGMKNPWRKEVIDKVSQLNLDIVILDPTVEDWEKDVGEETVKNENFLKQTDWEHDGLQKADIHVFHFDDTSMSPITLFELGMFVDRDSIVYLEEGYEKTAYVEYIAYRFGVPVLKSSEEVAKLLSIRFHTGRPGLHHQG